MFFLFLRRKRRGCFIGRLGLCLGLGFSRWLYLVNGLAAIVLVARIWLSCSAAWLVIPIIYIAALGSVDVGEYLPCEPVSVTPRGTEARHPVDSTSALDIHEFGGRRAVFHDADAVIQAYAAKCLCTEGDTVAEREAGVKTCIQ